MSDDGLIYPNMPLSCVFVPPSLGAITGAVIENPSQELSLAGI